MVFLENYTSTDKKKQQHEILKSRAAQCMSQIFLLQPVLVLVCVLVFVCLRIDIGIGGVCFDKFAAWPYFVAHQHRKYLVGFGRIR